MKSLPIVMLMVLFLTACLGGGGGSGAPAPNSNSQTLQVQGLAAQGKPLINVTISLKDSLGVVKQTQTATDGKFTFDSNGLTFPVLISGSDYLTVAYSASYVNLTPFTTMAVASLMNQSPSTIFNNFPSPSTDLKTLSDLRLAAEKIKTNLAGINLDLTNVNILEDQFQPVAGNKYDDLLEALNDYLVTNSLDITSYIDDILEETPTIICSSSEHLEGGVCVANTLACQTSTGSGTKTWSNNAWSDCNLSSCKTPGYIVVGGICVEQSPAGGNGGSDTYQSVVLEETSYEDVSPYQPFTQEKEGFSFIARESTASNPTSSGYLVESTGALSPFKISTPSSAGALINTAYSSMHKKDNSFFFFFEKIYKSMGHQSQATEIGGQSLGMNLVGAKTVRTGNKVYGFISDSGQPATFRYYDMAEPSPSLVELTNLPSGFDANSSELLGKDGQGNVIVLSKYYTEGSLAGYNYYSVNPSTQGITLIDTQSYANFKTTNDSFLINGTYLNYLEVGGKIISIVSVKSGASFKQHIQSIGNGTVSRTLFEDAVPLQANVFKDNLYIRSSFYENSNAKVGIRKISPTDASVSVVWSQPASGFEGGFTTYVMNSILGLANSDNYLYVITKRVATTNSVATNSYKLLSIDSAVSELSLPSSSSQLFDSPLSQETVNFNKLNYIKGGIAMITFGGDDRNKLYRMRVDNGEIELIKGDFYYNSYDDKSINHIWRSDVSKQVFITGETANTNGTYSKLFILK